MELSNQYPLISGHYKLLSLTIKNADIEGFFEAHDCGYSSKDASDSMKVDSLRFYQYRTCDVERLGNFRFSLLMRADC
jgi:hypothetical protein